MNLKSTILWLALLMGVVSAKGQPQLDSLAAMFDQLPSHLYPSQILHDRSPAYIYCWNVDSTRAWTLDSNNLASPYLYDGSIPAPLLKRSHWARMCADMKVSSTNPALVPDAATLFTRDSIARLNYDIPIGGMHLNYHRMNPFALDSGYLYYDTTLNKYTLMPDTLWFDRANNLFHYTENPDSLGALAFEEYEVFAGVLTETSIYAHASVTRQHNSDTT
ncbi:hypothetical protein [Phaeocystidibacter luteus]|uniref:Uncharacterized protein n=1 Tax=Phaeocystidibacter luteus TaxID=911197 RepID=A0A6N6RGH5_9FLAO|nr:hypothetical protein [Phaeocystidibacter luteus]KAB2807673.1 hypothetical protein F8C67_11575 [Phaeocystidibacter luteus]